MGMDHNCPRCQSDRIGHNIGMYFVAYECHDCKHQWIERLEIKNDKEASVCG